MFWYDGELIQDDLLIINISDPGLLYGATVFTTLRVYQQSLAHTLTHWTRHCDRLRYSLQTFGWQLPNWERIEQGAEVLLAHYPVLRITIFADGREWITGRFLPTDLSKSQQQGVIGWVANEPLYQRFLAAHKTGNYLGAWLALQKAQQLGVKEAILIDHKGNWLETSTGNLWGWKEGCWFTPTLEGGILPGIMRSQLLNWLQSQNLTAKQIVWTEEFVKNLEVIAYSNSVVEIIAFSKIIHPQFNLISNPFHPALKQLRSYFDNQV